MTQPQFQKFSKKILFRKQKSYKTMPSPNNDDNDDNNNSALRQMTVRCCMVIDAVRTYCGSSVVYSHQKPYEYIIVMYLLSGFSITISLVRSVGKLAPFSLLFGFSCGFMLLFALCQNHLHLAICGAFVVCPLVLLKFKMML